MKKTMINLVKMIVKVATEIEKKNVINEEVLQSRKSAKDKHKNYFYDPSRNWSNKEMDIYL